MQNERHLPSAFRRTSIPSRARATSEPSSAALSCRSVLPTNPPRRLRAIRTRSYVALQVERYRPKTAQIRYGDLQQFFKWAVEEREVDSSPINNIRRPTFQRAFKAIWSPNQGSFTVDSAANRLTPRALRFGSSSNRCLLPQASNLSLKNLRLTDELHGRLSIKCRRSDSEHGLFSDSPARTGAP